MNNSLPSSTRILIRKLIPKGMQVCHIGDSGQALVYDTTLADHFLKYNFSGIEDITIDTLKQSSFIIITSSKASIGLAEKLSTSIESSARIILISGGNLSEIESVFTQRKFEVIRSGAQKGVFYSVLRIASPLALKPSISIIVPCRNESGNIAALVRRIPDFGVACELIFVEGGSSDDTFSEIERVSKAYSGPISIKSYKQPSKGKKDAVVFGFEQANNELLMILDADLSVEPEALPEFYADYTNGNAEFINGSRLVFPMAPESMQKLNKMANRFFAWAFSKTLGQKVHDTLCGTKVISKKNWELIKHSDLFKNSVDPFGDFDLLTGAAYLHLKIKDVQIHYKARTYGSTNINRFRDGYTLFKILFNYLGSDYYY